MKKIIALIAVLSFVLSFAPTALCADDAPTVQEEALFRFDFGTTATDGYIPVSAKNAYSPEKGYGFATPKDVKNVTASGEGALSDAVEFTKFGTTSENTFNVDLPSGIYKIKVTAGDIERMSVACEGYFAIMNMTGNNCTAELVLPVTDGQLNILATEGKVDTKFSMSALEIYKMPDERKTTIFVGGDSTVTTYYPTKVTELAPTVQGGWGQMIQDFVTDDYYVWNFATGGQFAKGFLTSGQFDAIEHYMQEGDIFIVAFGINDQNYSNEEEFKESMREMVRRVKAKGGIPVVVTAQGRLTDFDLNDGLLYYKPDRWFKTATIDMAHEENAFYVDLHDISSAYFTRVGKEDTTGLYWIKWDGKQDTLHINRKGAGHCARLLVEEMVHQGILPQAKAAPYGYSCDLSWKINRTEDGSILVQNMLPVEQTLHLIRVKYNENDTLVGAYADEIVAQPSFDVFETDRTYILECDPNEHVYAYMDDKLVATFGDTAASYSLPSDTAHTLYDNYVAPEPKE